MDLYTTLAFLSHFLISLGLYIPGLTNQRNQDVSVFMFNATMNARQFVVPGQEFYNDVLHWTPERQAQFKVHAFEFFHERFGLDNVEHNSNLFTMLYMTNREVGTRCYVLAGQTVQDGGFPFLDAGWTINVINKAGIDLGGEFAGTHAPYGTTFTFGHWYIDRSNNRNQHDRTPLLWDIKHAAPGIQSVIGVNKTSHGEIDVSSPHYGIGKSLHVVKYTYHPDGNATAIFRNVVTF